MDINISQVLDFQRSEMDWYFKYVRKRVPKGRSTALDVGTWWHSLMEIYFKSLQAGPGPPSPKSWAAIEGARLRIEQSALYQDSTFDSQTRALLEDFSAYWSLAFEPSAIVRVESPFRIPLPETEHFLIGIPDTIVTIQNKLWHLQHKTTGTSTPSIYIASAQRWLHELAYAWAISHDFGITVGEYGGCYLNVARKLSAKARHENPQSMFIQELIPIDHLQVESAIRDISCIAERMSRIASGKAAPIQNRLADTNPWGSALSPYFAVNLGLASLDDDSVFQDLETRYDAKDGLLREGSLI